MFNLYKFSLETPLNDLDIKKFSYEAKQLKFISQIHVDPVDRMNVIIYYLKKTNLVEVKHKIDNFLFNWNNKSINKECESNKNNNADNASNLLELKTRGKNINKQNIATQLVDEGWIKLLKQQDLEFSKEMIQLLDFFDKSFVDYFSAHIVDYKAVKYSPLIPLYYIEKLKYLQTSPNHLMCASTINTEKTKDFVESIERLGGTLSSSACEHFNIPCNVLQTAPCLKIYFSLEDSELEKNQIYTVKGDCYRNEGKNIFLLERLLCFTQREFVFIGLKEFVEEHQKNALTWTIEWLDSLGIKACCRLANDPFFIKEEQHEDGYILPKNIKYEVCAYIPYKDDYISVASFDTHGNFFSKTFNFNLKGEKTVWSGCIGLGLERLVWSFLQQYGLDANKWPTVIKNELK